MTFDELLAQVLDLLRREGRVSYRALKRRFDLDDDDLEDLKDEIIAAKQLASDEQGRVLVWTGGPAAPQATAPLPQTETSLDTSPAQATRTAPSVAAPHVPEAERRQLTVLFCDLVDSTRLARQFDPEDWRDIVRAYQQACAAVIQRFDGYIAQYLGDGLLVYFGYPQAHEDDAQRAGRAGLGILETIELLNARLEQERGMRLAVRVGIHTGPVVVGTMGGGNRQEQLALGDTPNRQPGCRGWRLLTQWWSVPPPGGSSRGFLPARCWASMSSKGWKIPYGCPNSWRRAERRRGLTSWRPVPGRLWWDASKKWGCCWNAGRRARRGTGR